MVFVGIIQKMNVFQKNVIVVSPLISLMEDQTRELNNKKILSDEKSYLIYKFVKNEYRLDLLLYTLNFFTSIYQARQNIKNGLVLVNNKPITSERITLIKGDQISDREWE